MNRYSISISIPAIDARVYSGLIARFPMTLIDVTAILLSRTNIII